MLVNTLVTLFAPASDETAQAAANDPHAGRLNGARILLTEDNDINQQIAVELLEGVGAHMTVANKASKRWSDWCGIQRPTTWCSWICKCP